LRSQVISADVKDYFIDILKSIIDHQLFHRLIVPPAPKLPR
jgi:hypothetical protein